MLQFILLFLITGVLFAQIEAPINPIDFEQNPAHIAWKKIDTDHFEIIFPKEIEEEAQRAAHLLEKARSFVSRSLEVYPPRISLVLQNQSTISNGLVTLAPRRSEWYVTPSMDPEITNTEWLKTLAIHEFRHVVQFEKTRRGFNKFLEIILGEVGHAMGLAMTLPPWYFEGDAVGIETALSNGGRGRLAIFERDLRTLLLSGKDYDYDQAHIRSYEDYVPNHYVYGYFLTTHMRNKYGDFFLSKLANQSAETSWNPLSFYNSTDLLTQNTFEDVYRETIRELISAWEERALALNPTPYEVQNLGKRFGWTNYYFPQVTESGKILTLKRGLSFLNQFVLIDGKKEETLFYPGMLANEYPYKLRGNRLAFIELDLDPRWGQRDYSRLKVYDLTRDEFILDVPKTKWRLAVLNTTGDKVLLVEWNERQEQNVVVINLKNEILYRMPVPRKEVITSLDWYSDEEVVMVLKDLDDQKSIARLNLVNGTMTPIIGKTLTNFGFMAVADGHVLVESPESGIDNIYLADHSGMHQLTSSRYGAYAPTLHQDKLIYNDYSVDGMNVVKKELSWDEEQRSSGSFVHFYEKFAKSEDKDSFAARLAETEHFEVKDYSQFKNAFNLHSWLILAPPLTNTITLVGYSRDILNKFTLSAGGEYRLDEQTTQGFVGAVWSHLYPVFDLKAAYGNRKRDVTKSGETIENKWEEGTAEAGVQVPYQSIVGRFTQSFTLRAFAKIIQVTNKISSDITEVNDGALFSPGAEFSYNFLSRKATRDLLPPWGMQFSGHLEEGRDITGVDQKGSLSGLDSRYYLPGLWYHHSFYQQLAYERQRDDFYQYSSVASYPRGTRSIFLQEFTKYSANYTLPLFYPDWHWSRYVYFKRIAANLFYDELRGRYGTFGYDAASVGWEAFAETYFLRLLLPVTVGLRGSYIVKGLEKEDNYEFFITTDLGQF